MLIGGALAAYRTGVVLHNDGDTGNQVASTVAGIIAATVISASTFAFFGYVLGWALAIKVKFSRTPSAPIGRAGIRQLNRETSMHLAAFIGCLAVLVALWIFNLAGLGP